MSLLASLSSEQSTEKLKFGTVGFSSQCLNLLCWGPRVLFLCPLLSPLFLRCWNYLPLTHGTRELSCLAFWLPASKLTLGKEYWGVHTSLFMDIKQYLKKKSLDFKFLSSPPSLKNINIKRVSASTGFLLLILSTSSYMKASF